MRRAFTLIELLVVIAIIGILVALLLPAIQIARESASRMQCGNNLRSLATAAHTYHDDYKRFPAGVNLPLEHGDSGSGIWPDDPIYTSGLVGHPPIPDKYISWIEALMPFFEQEGLQKHFDFRQDQYFNVQSESSPGAQVVTILICPSDATMPLVRQYQSYYFGMTSYGANGGTRAWPWQHMKVDGVFFINSSVRLDHITDGASNTLLFGERTHNDPGSLGMPNHGGWAWTNVESAEDYILSTPVPVNYSLKNNAAGKQDDRTCAFGSEHPGGANFAFCDGSVRFLTLTANSDLPLLQALSTRAGGESITLPGD